MEAPVSTPEALAPESQNPAPAIAPTPAPAPNESSAPASVKPVHSLVVDANAIIKNDPPVSTLLSQAEDLYTIPAVVSEIRDEAARSRFQTTLQPFIKLRTPRPESVQFVTDFARRTGDLQVLSKPDLQLIALTYELELERNGGDWRLRKDPTQKRVNGKPPGRSEEGETQEGKPETESSPAADEQAPKLDDATTVEDAQEPTAEEVADAVGNLDIAAHEGDASAGVVEEEASTSEEEVEDDGEGEWITPSNIKKHQARENTSSAPQPIQRVLQAALITADMAMRNVALRINLNLLDSGFSRITFLKTWVLRCHGCWHVCKDTTKQFCPKCGHDSLTRVSCTTDASGNFTLHLKKNFQFNKRGNVFSIPKPTHGTANGRQNGVKGGGKNGWGNELILAEDQKEYIKRTEEDRRTRYRDLMDDDYLPGILTGARSSGPGRIKVGAGRNVNAKKKR